MIKYIYFDVSGTLLHKPILFEKIQVILQKYSYNIGIKEIKTKHKLLSEVIKFPDRTDENFYKKFNSELLYLLGIIPSDDICKDLFESCTYLPWEKYEDTEYLKDVKLPLGIISNFNSTLKNKLDGFFGPIFKDIYVSEELGVSKPDELFYKKAIESCNLKPEEILYIGDSIKLDLEPAVSLGLRVLVIDRGGFYKTTENIIRSLYEIPDYLT
ncbi:HAD family hydrolase [uncultured Zobellia sp.]|uniref:HAD family hydrolase n=1 Tax=uncultured Zobellia sp. TaxID=255433 RepID=UPI00259A85E0|nr:HAD family hydrolase [uncultured Zobellia sp.]